MLWQRALTAAVGIPIALVLIYLGGWYLSTLVAALALLGLLEYYRLAASSGGRVRPFIGYLVALPILFTPAPYQVIPIGMMFLLLCLGSFTILSLQALQFARKRTLEGSALPGYSNPTLTGLVYVPTLFAHINLLRALPGESVSFSDAGPIIPFGAALLALVVIACWANDTAAYFVGRAIGRHKLCPKISPGKTVEGAIAGLLAAVIVTERLARWVGLPLIHAVLLGAILGVVAQLGDLFESSLKRRAAVKDSGALLPGHGGVLDRFDSLLFAAPAAYYYASWLLGI